MDTYDELDHDSREEIYSLRICNKESKALTWLKEIVHLQKILSIIFTLQLFIVLSIKNKHLPSIFCAKKWCTMHIMHGHCFDKTEN